MRVTIDAVGRILIPKTIRDQAGLRPGETVDISIYGLGLTVIADSRTARIVERDGVLVAESTTVVDDDTMFGLIDAGRR